MTDVNAFQPNGSTVNLALSTSTGNVALPGVGNGANVRVYNAGTTAGFITFGTASTVTAALATSMPIPPGAVEMFTLPAGITYVAGISASGAPTLYFTTGQGI